MSFGIKPLGTRVVMKRFEAEEKTQGGIILSGQAKEQPQMAEIVAAGPGTKDEKMELAAGDKVVFLEENGRIFIENAEKLKFAPDEHSGGKS